MKPPQIQRTPEIERLIADLYVAAGQDLAHGELREEKLLDVFVRFVNEPRVTDTVRGILS